MNKTKRLYFTLSLLLSVNCQFMTLCNSTTCSEVQQVKNLVNFSTQELEFLSKCNDPVYVNKSIRNLIATLDVQKLQDHKCALAMA